MNEDPTVRFEWKGNSYKNKDLLRLWLYSGRLTHRYRKGGYFGASLPEPARKDLELQVQAVTHSLIHCLVIIGSVISLWLDTPKEVVSQVTSS